MSQADPAWSVHLGTALETRVLLELGRLRPGDPWPLPRALTELGRLGAVRDRPPRTLGSGRGMPLLSAQQLLWSGCAIQLECRGDGAGAEAALELPSWDELVDAAAGEDAVWELIDTFAAAVDGTAGVITDGEAALPADVGGGWLGALRRHVGVLVAAGELDPGPAGCRYRVLPRSGLEVVLR